jgi:hypothetical protein
MGIFFEIYGHVFNIIYVVALVMKNMLWLRITMIIAASMELIYRLLTSKNPDVDIIWCVVWIIVNSVQLIILIRERMNLKLNDDEEKIYQISFNKLPKVYFKKLLQFADWENVKPGTILIREGSHIDKLMLIFSGVAKVQNAGIVTAYLRDGNFMGEMSYISGNPTSADVMALSEIRMISWEKEKLSSLLKKYKQIDEGMKVIFNIDLVKKLSKKK